MKYFKRAMQITAFLMGLVIILLGLSYLFVPKNNNAEGDLNGKFNGILGEKSNTIDVIVLGDSESFSAISPMEIWGKAGYTSYVCGSVEQPLDYSFKILKKVFTNQSPKVVVIETNTIFREVNFKSSLITKLDDVFTIIENHNRWKKFSFKTMLDKVDYTWTDNNKGYYFSKVISASDNPNYMIPTDESEEIAQANLYILKDIKDFCDSKGAKLVLLSTPSTKNWNYERHNGISKMAKDFKVDYIDLNLMNDTIKIDWNTDTRDKGDHLNHSGAVKVTNYLSEYLISTSLLVDKRNNAEYQNWNNLLDIYHELVN